MARGGDLDAEQERLAAARAAERVAAAHVKSFDEAYPEERRRHEAKMARQMEEMERRAGRSAVSGELNEYERRAGRATQND